MCMIFESCGSMNEYHVQERRKCHLESSLDLDQNVTLQNLGVKLIFLYVSYLYSLTQADQLHCASHLWVLFRG